VILADTSVWVRHLRSDDAALAELLARGRVAMHPLVVGEVACGMLRNRSGVLGLMRTLPAVPVAEDDEALGLIERQRLMGRGIGYPDVHLLASTLLAGDTRLWTLDRRLAGAAARLSVSFEP
jgi:predicted nucleic acid-binding protein